jgi:hypothetical protein
MPEKKNDNQPDLHNNNINNNNNTQQHTTREEHNMPHPSGIQELVVNANNLPSTPHIVI